MADQKKNKEDLGAKLFEDFNIAFLRLSQVNEVCIIYNEDDNSNKCPIHVQGDCIGVEKWCIMHLFTYAYENLMKVEGSEDADYVDCLTRCVVLFCPDCTTSWNIRKKFCISRVESDGLNKELKLTELSLRKLPKSTETFSHRRWILKLLFGVSDSVLYLRKNHTFLVCAQCEKPCGFKQSSTRIPALTNASNELLQRELTLCGEVASWHPSNYSCWNHRLWLINYLLLPGLLTCYPRSSTRTIEEKNLHQNLLSSLTLDLSDVMNWMERHVSDHSCMSYIAYLLNILTLLCFLQKEILCKCTAENPIVYSCNMVELTPYWSRALRQVEDLLRLHDGAHEALWCHRRALLVLLQKYKKVFAKLSGLNKLAEDVTLAKEKEFCAQFMNKQATPSTYQLIEKYLNYVMKYVF